MKSNSTIITSNRDFDEWPSIFTNSLLGSAALDRLVHKGIQIIIEGSSYRLTSSKKLVQKQKNITISITKKEIKKLTKIVNLV